MKLQKIIPAHTMTAEASWCRKDFCTMSDGFRAIRRSASDKMDRCYWCKSSFSNGDMLALAAFTGGNRALCQGCADQLISSEPLDESIAAR